MGIHVASITCVKYRDMLMNVEDPAIIATIILSTVQKSCLQTGLRKSWRKCPAVLALYRRGLSGEKCKHIKKAKKKMTIEANGGTVGKALGH